MQTNAIGTKEAVVMKCPVCKSPELLATVMEDGLTFHNCPQGRGNWIRGAEYWKWLEQHGSTSRNDLTRTPDCHSRNRVFTSTVLSVASA